VTHWRPAAILVAAGLLVLVCFPAPLRADEPLRLYAAGSLRRALSEVSAAFTEATGIRVQGTFGASGLLRERLEGGERGDVFASADMDHPRRLATQGRAGAVTVFTRNRLCALARPGLTATSEDLLQRMLDPAVRLGTSTPKADPSGDYAWGVFERAETLQAGARAQLEAKALMLTGGREAPAPSPTGRSVYTELIAKGAADLFLTYCTNAAVSHQEMPEARVIELPPALSVGADYGVTALTGLRQADAARLIAFLLSSPGQAILRRHGFSSPGG
jgi:ABC-type molybdate transport system substrate-binding protein